jgi:hypothetical protein
VVIIMFARVLKQWTTIKCCLNDPFSAKKLYSTVILRRERSIPLSYRGWWSHVEAVPFQVAFYLEGSMRGHHNKASSPLALDGRTGLRRGIGATRHPPN